MQHSDFRVGGDFAFYGQRCRCTDLGSRVVVYIEIKPIEFGYRNGATGELKRGTLSVEEAEAQGWFKGPPYAVVELMIDEHDIELCEPATVA